MTKWQILAAVSVIAVSAGCSEPQAPAGGDTTLAMAEKSSPATASKRSGGPMVVMFQVQKDAPDGDFDTLAAAGVTHVQSFRLATWPDDIVRPYFDGAAKAGLGIIVALNPFLEGTDGSCRYQDAAFDFIRRYKDHPAHFGWQLVDEPAEHGITAACQRALYKEVKKLDPRPNILVTANNNSRAKYAEFFAEDAFDILEIHKYVNPSPSKAEQRLLDLFVEQRSREYPVIMTFRAFNSPHRERRVDMIPGSLEEQYQFFVVEPGLTRNYGFYGWDLSPNLGIKQLPALRVEFDAFMARRRAEQR